MLYQESKMLYKAHTESFLEDLDYYYAFCKGKKSLEMFAGYGRLANPLLQKGIDLETVELEPYFANFINLPPAKNHFKNVLDFNSPHKFQRIFAAYNSFCLLLKEVEIRRFFSVLDNLLVSGGKISLSYFQTRYWPENPSGKFWFNGFEIEYRPNYDLSKAKEGYGVWIDEYIFPNNHQTKHAVFEYPVRIYHSEQDLKPFYEHTNLVLIDQVPNLGLDEKIVSELGWIDYVFEKKL